MKRFFWSVCALAAVLSVASVTGLAAQGVTTAAVTGRVTDESGAAVALAEVTLLNGSTGERYAARTADDGSYHMENVSVGGPYTLSARALGFEPTVSEAFQLALGQRFVLNVSMKRSAVQIAGVTITATSDALISTSRTGASTFLSDRAIHSLPTLNRRFDDFISTAPQAVGRSFTGQNDRFNNIQIDGASNNDIFNLGSSNGTPGGGVGARPLSLESVQEYQILIAPFDVRQGGFVGGLVNAVTKSGTNQLHGSAFGYSQNEEFVGRDTGGVSVPFPPFQQQQYGFSLGGPIIRDRLHFFASGDFRHDSRPFAFGGVPNIGPNPGNPADTAGIGITQARADSVTNILRDSAFYGFNPGTWATPTMLNPETNVFGKLDYAVGTNSHVEVSGTYVSANQDKLTRTYTTPSAFPFRDGYQLSNSGWNVSDKTKTLRGKWTSLFAGRFSNELIAGYSSINDVRTVANNVPLILVRGNVANTWLGAGSDRFSVPNTLKQTVYELTDNVTFPVHSHLITVGTHNEFFHFFNAFFPASTGVWDFADPLALAAKTPNRYEIALPLKPGGPTSDFHVKQFGFYAEDQFPVMPKLRLTVGLRVDVPSQPAPTFNPTLDTTHFPALGGQVVNTGSFPSGNLLWSPRLGFNYDVSGDRQTILRGGVGIFSGRPPYVWLSNAYGNTGMEQITLVCDGAGTTTNGTFDTVPAFTINEGAQPSKCGTGGPGSIGPSTSATSIVFFDQNFKFPQALKLALGVDHQFAWGIFGTIDFLYTKSVNQFYLQDVNLAGVQGLIPGEGGRLLYGTVTTGPFRATPKRVVNNFADVVENRNVSADQSTSSTFQLQKQFSNGIQFNAAYTYTHTLDLISLTSDITSSNFRNAVLDGPIENRNLRTSSFARPHKVTVSGTVTVPLDARFSLIYNGVSGTPFTYTVSGDINADGVSGNDPVYVPRDAADITMGNPADYAKLDAYINTEPCLASNRGRILPRNACHNPWINTLNARLSKTVPTTHGQTIEITADLLNVLNLLNSKWGLVRTTGSFDNPNLITAAGYDFVNQRGIYNLRFPVKNSASVSSLLNRWVFQLGARYAF